MSQSVELDARPHIDSPEESFVEGTVIRKSTGQYWVAGEAGSALVVCSLTNMLRKQLVYPIADPTSWRPHVLAVKEIRLVDPVAIGDRVRFLPAGPGCGQIQEVLPRRSKLSRRAAGAQPLEQVIVANADQVVVVFAAAQPAVRWNLVDRYLVSTEACNLPALLCFTKLDLVKEEDLLAELEPYRHCGYRILLTSSTQQVGIEELRQALHGKLSALVGSSGVGKTTLLNTLEPGLGQRVREISKITGKGRHTTSSLEMYTLTGGGFLVDSPGMREYGLWNVDPNHLASLFPEMRPYLGNCRFGVSCRHDKEPGCAVKKAMEEGAIHPRRYQSWLRLASSLREE